MLAVGPSCSEFVLITWRLQPRFSRILQIGWSEKADIWSLGCILFELYTGNVPVNAEGLIGSSVKDKTTRLVLAIRAVPHICIHCFNRIPRPQQEQQWQRRKHDEDLRASLLGCPELNL